MINVSGNKWIPSEGFAFISNGEVCSDSIFLGKDDNIENWYDTNEEPVPEEYITDEQALSILLGGEAE